MDIARRLTVTLTVAAVGLVLAGSAAATGSVSQRPTDTAVVAGDPIGWPGDDSAPSGATVVAIDPIGWPGDDSLTS